MAVNGKQKGNREQVLFGTTVESKSIINTKEVILNPKDNSGVFKDKDGNYKKSIKHDEGYRFVTPDREEIEKYRKEGFKKKLRNGK